MKQIFSFITAMLATIICNAQANTKLSNLVSPTAVNVSLLPGGTTGTKNLGSDTKRWKNGYFNATVFAYGTGSTYGVYAQGNNYGLYGSSSNGYGVAGGSGFLGVYGSGGTYGLMGSGGSYGLYAYATGNSGYGVYGSSSGYGVYGDGGTGVKGNSTVLSGIGVFASADNGDGLYAYTGNNATYWAGYFVGDVFSSTGVYAGSDARIKQNVRDFTSAIDIIDKLQPKQYEFKSDGNYKLMNLPHGTHFGLIAQDVEKVLPNLVKTSHLKTPVRETPHSKERAVKQQTEISDFKALNYTELIPLVIKGMQEQQSTIQKQQSLIEKQQSINEKQQQQIDELNQLLTKFSSSSSKISAFNISSAYLKQNAPNPFSKNTIIQCYVPSSATQAQLILYNADGRQLKTFTISSSGINEVTINAGTLPSGQYIYSLLVDGKKVDSKKMIITK